jgi:peptide-methionine (S)-S-oxide reductase
VNTNTQNEEKKGMENATKSSETVGKPNLDTVILGGGCFWCIEAVFDELKGVQKVVSGYSGGGRENPTYREVCSGQSGHVEVVEIIYDTNELSYEDLLRVFFHVHDPTTPNRQGNDAGEQYKSAIFYANDAQRDRAKKIIEEVQNSKLWGDKKIVTEMLPFLKFYSAEEYHQKYYVNNPNQGYCSFVVGPKVAKFRKEFKDKLKTKQGN